MLLFSNSKLNIGLNVTAKRADGFHNIETIFFPINWCDALEVIENKDITTPIEFTQSGLLIDSTLENNLIYKTWQLVTQTKKIPPIKVHLHKNIPMGAGLGGGSANAAFFINSVNTLFNLNFSETDKLNIASKIGSDCAFFIKNKPVFAQGKGNEFSDIRLDLSSYYILIIFPDVLSSTKEAYLDLTPKQTEHNLKQIVETKPIENWKDFVTNDFETVLFKKYPQIKQLKDLLYANHAIYASMSGSGSAVYGVFKQEPTITLPTNYKSFLKQPIHKGA